MICQVGTGAPIVAHEVAYGLHGLAEPLAFPRAQMPVVRYGDGGAQAELVEVICESELTVVANGVELVRLLCSGAALRELAYGFLYSEGIVRCLGDVLGCSVDVSAMEVSFDLAVPVRRPGCPTVSSGFGGKVLRSPLGFERPDRRGSVDADELRGRRARVPGEEDARPGEKTREVRRRLGERGGAGSGRDDDGALPAEDFWTGGFQVEPFSIDEVFLAMAAMDGAAVEYHATRGMHCSALFRGSQMLGCFEDIGCHNTFDKLAGHCLLNGISPEGALLTTTGRVSAEMCTKALRIGVAAVASCSGPTDAAVRLARGAGVMLVGYAGKSGRAVRYG